MPSRDRNPELMRMAALNKPDRPVEDIVFDVVYWEGKGSCTYHATAKAVAHFYPVEQYALQQPIQPLDELLREPRQDLFLPWAIFSGNKDRPALISSFEDAPDGKINHVEFVSDAEDWLRWFDTLAQDNDILTRITILDTITPPDQRL